MSAGLHSFPNNIGLLSDALNVDECAKDQSIIIILTTV